MFRGTAALQRREGKGRKQEQMKVSRRKMKLTMSMALRSKNYKRLRSPKDLVKLRPKPSKGLFKRTYSGTCFSSTYKKPSQVSIM